MAGSFGRKLKITLGGKPSDKEITVRMEGVPEGTVIDYGQLSQMIDRWDNGVGMYGGDAPAQCRLADKHLGGGLGEAQ